MTLKTAALALAASLTAVAAGAGDRALVIGIDTYPELGLDRALSHARSDAERFRDFLVEHWDFDAGEITLLRDAEATSTAIMDALIDRLVAETTPGDRVVFYFSGLGSRIADTSGNEPDGLTEVLLAYDTASLLGKMPKDAFADILDLIPGRDVTLIIDASHDGGLGLRAAQAGAAVTRGVSLDMAAGAGRLRSSPGPAVPESFTEPPFGAGQVDRTIWAAAAPSQFAWEAEGGGVFTTAFLDGLAEGAADVNENGVVTNAELLVHIRDRAEAWCARTPECVTAGRGLTPHFAGEIEAIVGTRAMAPSSAEAPIVPALQEGTRLSGQPGDASLDQTLGLVTDLFSPSNAANLRISIDGAVPLTVGDIVSFSVSADREGTLVLLDVTPDGELVQVFPSSLSATGTTRIAAGESLTIPNGTGPSGRDLRIRVTEPAGQGFLLGLFVEDDLPTLEAVLPENLAGGPVPNAAQYLYEIAQDLLALQVGPDGTTAVEWSAVYLPYEIVP